MKIKVLNKAKADPPSPFNEAPGYGGTSAKVVVSSMHLSM